MMISDGPCGVKIVNCRIVDDEVKNIKVDFNMVTDTGMVRAAPSNTLRVGDWVKATDFGDPDMAFIGVVDHIDDEGFACLSMDWEDDLAEIDTTPEQFDEYMARSEPVVLVEPSPSSRIKLSNNRLIPEEKP